MAVLILDPIKEAECQQILDRDIKDRYDEVWEGVTVVPPMPRIEHQSIQFAFTPFLYELVVLPQLGSAYTGVNVSDRGLNWTQNYRAPDIAVYLNHNPAIFHDTHWEGGPDFLVEIISPGEDPHSKLPFYEKINTREVLIIHRDPWMLELFQLNGSKLDCVGISDMALSQTIASGVLSLTFQLVQGTNRPEIVVVHTQTQQQWRV